MPANGKPPAAPSGYLTAHNSDVYTYVLKSLKDMPTPPSSIPSKAGVTLEANGQPVTKSGAPTTTTTLAPTTTTTAPPAGSAASQLNKYAGTDGLGTPVGTAATATTTNPPGVTAAEAAIVVPFTLVGEKPDFAAPATDETTQSGGGTTMSFDDFMNVISGLQGDKAELIKVQQQLKAGGYYTSKSWASYGTLDSATKDAWKALGEDAGSTGGLVSASSLLAAGSAAPQLVSDMQAVQEKINSAQEAGYSATSSSVDLTDPNQVKQTLQTAADSMGINLTAAQIDQFASAFSQAQVSAEQNEVAEEKKNDLNDVSQLQGQMTDLQSGDVTLADQAAATPGPTAVATKAAPDLDAEAIATAKSINPAMYDATGSSDLYGLIQRALSGNLQQPTTPSSPTSQSASGGLIATEPLVGAP